MVCECDVLFLWLLVLLCYKFSTRSLARGFLYSLKCDPTLESKKEKKNNLISSPLSLLPHTRSSTLFSVRKKQLIRIKKSNNHSQGVSIRENFSFSKRSFIKKGEERRPNGQAKGGEKFIFFFLFFVMYECHATGPHCGKSFYIPSVPVVVLCLKLLCVDSVRCKHMTFSTVVNRAWKWNII